MAVLANKKLLALSAGGIQDSMKVAAPQNGHGGLASVLTIADSKTEGTTARVMRYGLCGWLRAANVMRVLGLLAFYLFLDGYDFRAGFNRRMAARKRSEARARGRVALFQEWSRDVDRRLIDKLVRLVRLIVFRGANESAAKERQIEKQSVWLKESLIKLGPTFIKIGQSLGTRADLLPLAYVKELATLQDQVPPFPVE